ncbi:immediate early response gene 2 protein [Porphyrio hochstetteri]
MEEAQRLLTVSVWKLYRCRLQRGGLRLHRSLQLSLLVRAARHRYLSARAAVTETGPAVGTPPGTGPGDAQRYPPAPDRAGAPGQPIPDRGRAAGQPTPEGTPGQPAPDRGNPPNLPTRDPRSSPDPANREQPQDAPIRYRDPPSSPRLPCPTNAPPASPRCIGALPGVRTARKRRSSGSTEPGPVPVPTKRARLETEETPSLVPGPPGRCSGPPAAAFGFLVRAVGAC